jgi:carbamoyl-phosphate synthase large subunit
MISKKTKFSRGTTSLHDSNILILSTSRKTSLCRWFLKAARKFEIGVLGTDLNPNAPALSLLDGVVYLPHLDAPDFIDDLLRCIEECRIKLIIPTRDSEVLFFPQHAERIEKTGCLVLCNDSDITQRMVNKVSFMRFCKEKLDFDYLRVIVSAHEATASDFPLFFRGIKDGKRLRVKVLNQRELEACFDLCSRGVASTYFEGIEVSVDCYVSREGRIIYIVPRSRDIVLDTESIVTTAIDSEICRYVTEQVIKLSGIKGPIVLQGMLKGDRFLPFEVNLRFGGASALSFQAAFSGPELVLREYFNKETLVETFPFKVGLKLFKDFVEVYT